MGEDVVTALRKTYKILFELGLFDPIDDQPYWHYPLSMVNTKETDLFNLEMAQEGMVLLKNKHNLLPIKRGKKIAVIGPHSKSKQELYGNYNGVPCWKDNKTGTQNDDAYKCTQTPFEGIQVANEGGETNMAFGCTDVRCENSDGFQEAIDLATNSDVVVMFMGIDAHHVEKEGHDRTEISLPGYQDDLVQKISNLKKPTIIFLINGGTLGIDKILKNEHVHGVFEALYPGIKGAEAMAGALFGDFSPSGKLPYTMYPTDYINKVDMYSMDMMDGPGRTYRYYKEMPLYPFGYGLSYTKFNMTFGFDTLDTVRLSSTNNEEDFEIFSMFVTNYGDRSGKEVIQAYFVPEDVKMNGPMVLRQMFGFEKLHLEPNEIKKVSFKVDIHTLGLVNTDGDLLSVPGKYKLIFTNGFDINLERMIVVDGAKAVVLEEFPTKNFVPAQDE